MRKMFLLVLCIGCFPATALARDHSPFASATVVTIIAIAALIWAFGVPIFKSLSNKKSSKSQSDKKLSKLQSDPVSPPSTPTRTAAPTLSVAPDEQHGATSSSLGQVEDSWYEQALDELEKGQTVKATWAKALVEANGDDAKSRATYIRLRVNQLKAERTAEVNRLGISPAGSRSRSG